MTDPNEPQATPTAPEQAPQEQPIRPTPPRVSPDWMEKGGWPKGAEKRGDGGKT